MATIKGTLEDWRLLQLNRARKKTREYNKWQVGLESSIKRIAQIREKIKEKNPDKKFKRYGKAYNDFKWLKERKCI